MEGGEGVTSQMATKEMTHKATGQWTTQGPWRAVLRQAAKPDEAAKLYEAAKPDEAAEPDEAAKPD